MAMIAAKVRARASSTVRILMGSSRGRFTRSTSAPAVVSPVAR